MTEKEKYIEFCKKVYVPIYSKPWWMDAVCGEENWDVWLYEKGGAIWAAMPYYKQKRGNYHYITKAPLTQNNGLIISYPENQKIATRQAYEEQIINAAVEYIANLGVDVYEQQFMTDFHNFLPYYWNDFEIIPRITYVIEKTEKIEETENQFTSNYKNTIRKGEKSIENISFISPEIFYTEHEKIFARQGLPCPFSYELWMRLYKACSAQNAGRILTARNKNGDVMSLVFLVSDERSMYLLLGGEIPEYARLQTYTVLVRKSIRLASKQGLKFDFEGSVIQRINHAFREYGGIPKQYFRIRKVFNPEIIRAEAEQKIRKLSEK